MSVLEGRGGYVASAPPTVAGPAGGAGGAGVAGDPWQPGKGLMSIC